MVRERTPRRRGETTLTVFVALTLLVALPLVAWRLSDRLFGGHIEKSPLMTSAERKDYIHTVLTRGEVESSVNAEVECEVEAGHPTTWVPTILEVVPEGTMVEEGDFLLRLDVSFHEEKARAHRQYIDSGKIWQAMAIARLETAKSRLREFTEGTYELALTLKNYQIFTAKEDVRTAEIAYGFSKILLHEGIITTQQLDADHFAVQSAENKLQRAEVGSEVLRMYTREKTVRELESEIAAAEAQKQDVEQYMAIFTERIAHYDEQVAKGVLTAPVAGQVVHAHLHHNGHSHMVEIGEKTQEHRVLIKLPDPKQMQVKALVPENRINDVKEGMPAEIRLDALPEVTLTGRVKAASTFAESDSFLGSTVKQFEVLVTIDPESVVANSADLRPGLTADVTVISDQRDDKLQIPFQAVLAHGKKRFGLTLEDNQWKALELQTGPGNGKFIIVEKGLSEGQQVALNAQAYRKEIEWPELPPEEAEPKTPVAPARKLPKKSPPNRKASSPGREA